mgnify:CR=1 FL=1
MGIPIAGGKMKELLDIYRDAWKAAGHPGQGRAMLAFFMFCHEDHDEALRIARPHVDNYFVSLCDAASGWTTGSTSNDYAHYDKIVETLRQENLDTQIDYNDQVGGFDDGSLQVNFTTLPADEAEISVRLFGEKVIPHFS